MIFSKKEHQKIKNKKYQSKWDFWNEIDEEFTDS